MNDRIMQFRVGVMVLASILICAILVALFGNMNIASWFQQKKTIIVKFNVAPGVKKETPVRKNGVLIGRVTDVQVDEGAVITIEIDADRPVRRNDVCLITANLLGDATLDFVPGDEPGADRSLLEEGDVITGQVRTSLFDVIANLEGEMGDALKSLTVAGEQVSRLAVRVDTMLGDNDEQFRRLLENTDRAMVSFDRTMGNMDKIIGDEKIQNDIRRTFERLPILIEETQKVVEAMQVTVRLADKNLNQLDNFTRPLGERGEIILKEMQEAAGRVNVLMDELTIFSRALNRREGSLGQLVHNPDLYNRLDRAAATIEKLVQEMRPVVYNARVFTDKIARDPSQLGVGGALRKNSGVK